MQAQACRLLAALLVICAPATAVTGDTGPAAALIQSFNDRAVELIEATEDRPEERAQGLRQLLRDEMAMGYLGDLLLGQARHDADPDQLPRYRAVFPEYMAAQYAEQLVDLAQQEFRLGDSIERRFAGDVALFDSGEVGDFGRDIATRIHQLTP